MAQQTTSPVDELSEYGRSVYTRLERDLSAADSSLLLAKLIDLRKNHLGNLEKAAIDVLVGEFGTKIDRYVLHPGSE